MRVINLLFKHLLLVLFVLIFVALAAVIGFFVSEPIVIAMARVFPGIRPSAWYSILIEVIFSAFVLSGLLIGVAALATIDRAVGESKWTSLSPLLRLLAAVVGIVSGTIAGGMMAVSRYRASLPPPDPDSGGIDFAGDIIAFFQGAFIGFITILIISIVLLTIWEYRRSSLEEEVLSLSLNSPQKSE